MRIERQYKSKKMNLMLFYKALSAFSRGAEQQNLCPARISNLVSTCFVLFFILFIYFFAWRRWFVPDWSITVLYQVLLSAVMVIKSGDLFSFFFLIFSLVFSSPSGCQSEFVSSGNIGEVGKMSKRGRKMHFKVSC